MTLVTPDGTELFFYQWMPEGSPRGVVQIVHGLAEHAGRYDRLARALTAAGYGVYAHDHRGHGRTAPTADALGFFAERAGWQKCLDDLGLVTRRIATDRPGVPIVLLGHSMGSFMVQDFMSEHGEALAGVVLSASNGRPSAWAAVGRIVARIERLRLGPRGKSALIHALAFGAFNKPSEPARTPFDWLSRDPDEVDRYLADPLCGFRPSVQLWIDLLDALPGILRPARLARIPKRLPIHVVSGGNDPVSESTRGAERLLTAYRAAGLEKVTHRFYPDARHELFHETIHEEVTRDLIAWLDRTGTVRRET